MGREDGCTVNLSDYQVMYGDLLMGPGTTYDVDWSTLGLLDAPPVRASDIERARGDGVWQGEEFVGSQTFPLSVQMFGWERIDVGTAVRAFLDNTTPRVPRDLWFKVPHLEEPRCLLGVKVRRRAVPVTRLFGGKVRAELDLFAPDPARYGPEMKLNATLPGRSRVAGVNPGDLDTWPRFYLSSKTGITQPITIRHLETGDLISIATTTGPDEVLVIDPTIGTAVVDYVSDRTAALVHRQWWTVPSRSNFTVQLLAEPGVSMDIIWRASWW